MKWVITFIIATIASRNKVRPNPRFQKVATSHLLSQVRRDSLLISKDPERFLETIVKNPGDDSGTFSRRQLNASNSITSFLSGYVDKQSDTSRNYQASIQKLDLKRRQTKNRTLLLSLGANPDIRHKLSGTSISSRSSVTNLSSTSSTPNFSTKNPFFLGADDQSTTDGDADGTHLLNYSTSDTDTVLQSFLDDIRRANVDNILTWVATPVTLNDMILPIGLPSSTTLRIPTMNATNSGGSHLKNLDFVKSAMEEFFLLDAEYHTKVEELLVKITDNFREIEMAAWPSKDSALLFHLMTVTQTQSGSHFSNEKLCTEVASRIFPEYSREDIIAQKYRLKVKKALEEKRDNVLKHWQRDKENLVKKINAAWDDIQKKQKVMEDFQQERKAQQEKCQYWTDLLEKMRKENQKRIRQIQTLVEPLEEQLRHKQRVKEKQEKGRRLEQKQLIEKFHKLKLEEEEEHKRRQEEIQAALEKDRKIRQIHNRTRVHMRKREFEMKREHWRNLERQKEEDVRRRQDILEKTKEKVEIDYHPVSVLQDTHASLVRSHEIQSLINFRDPWTVGGSAPEETVKFFQERYSFSAETLWKDTRVRLESKLREAGLIDSSYARQMLLSMQPQQKQHLQSQIKLDEDW